MTKIKNRFRTGEIITVHDNLLCDLYSLNRDTGFELAVINDCQYLINQKQGRNYTIGLRVKIPEELLIVDNYVHKFEELDIDTQIEIEDKLSSYLYFSNLEIYVTNMLFDKYLHYGNNCKISIQELEGYYRKSKKDYRKVRVANNVYDRYVDTLKSLVDKEIFIETNNLFRNDKYGVRNINFSHRFLSIFNVSLSGANNIEFAFSFQKFGNVIKQCRRYSNTLSRNAFKIRLNQSMKYSTAFFIARDVFIVRGNLRHNPNCIENEIIVRPEKYDFIIKYDGRKNDNQGYSLSYKLNSLKGVPNKHRIRKMFINYIKSGFMKCDVYELESEYSYNETEEFVEKHEFDYDEHYNLHYDFSIDDLGNDVDVTLHVYVNDPNVIMCEEMFSSDSKI